MTDTHWTIAYRRPRANRFIRKDLALSWQEAFDLAGTFGAAHPGLEVWYVTNRAAEISGYCHPEDVLNILTASGRRVRIYEEIPGREVS